MVAILDRDGMIRTVNQSWRRFGLENGAEDPCMGVGRSYIDVCTAASDTVPECKTMADSIRAVLAGQMQRFESEYSCRINDGTMWFSMTVTALNDREFSGAVVMHTDITARRQAEAVALASERLAVAGRMAATVAHEINNPLAGIKNAFELVKTGVDPKHPHVGFIPLIETEIDRMGRIVRQMLDLHRPGREIPRRFKLAETVSDVVLFLNQAARRRHITLSVDVPPGGCPVTLPESDVRQVLYNLIQNAIDASANGQTVEIEMGRLDIASVQLKVKDRGVGIPTNLMSKIFEPFFTTKSGSDSSGTGLGLAVSRSLIEAMGGRIKVETVVGSGSTFIVTVPTPEGA